MVLRQQSSDTEPIIGLDVCNEGNKQDIKIKNNQGEEQEEFTLESVSLSTFLRRGLLNSDLNDKRNSTAKSRWNMLWTKRIAIANALIWERAWNVLGTRRGVSLELN